MSPASEPLCTGPSGWDATSSSARLSPAGAALLVPALGSTWEWREPVTQAGALTRLKLHVYHKGQSFP